MCWQVQATQRIRQTNVLTIPSKLMKSVNLYLAAERGRLITFLKNLLGSVHKNSSIDASNFAPTLLPNTNSFWNMDLEQLILVGHEGWVGVAFTLMCDTIWCKFALYWGKGTWKCSPSGAGKAASFAPKKTVTTSGGEDNWFPIPHSTPIEKLQRVWKSIQGQEKLQLIFFPCVLMNYIKLLQIR